MKEQKEKRVIKRYRNRKLYDTEDSCYVTLEDIADLIRSGEDVKIIENVNSEDITSVTLAQIILEEERRKKESLPLSTLFQLVRSGGETIKHFVQKSIGEGVKEISHVKDEMYDNLERISHQAPLNYEEGTKFINNIKNFIEKKVKTTVENVQNIPSVKSEVAKMKNKIEELEKGLSPSKKKKTTKKKVVKKKTKRKSK